MRYLVPGPTPCSEVVAVFYIRLAEVPTLFSVEGDAQVEQQNTVVGFLTDSFMRESVEVLLVLELLRHERYIGEIKENTRRELCLNTRGCSCLCALVRFPF